MIPYERLILERIEGDTPRKQFERLKGMQILLQQVAYPRRGTKEEQWKIQDVADRAQKLVELDTNYND